MIQNPLTIIKLIVLYMLDRVSFPLTKAQIGDFITEKEYTTYMKCMQAISELIDDSWITAKSLQNRTHLVLTEEGRTNFHYLDDRINDAIKTDIDSYLKENDLQLRNEVSIVSNYYKSTNGEYIAELTANDKGSELVNIRLSVPVREMAISVCDNWQKKNQEVYKFLTEQLF